MPRITSVEWIVLMIMAIIIGMAITSKPWPLPATDQKVTKAIEVDESPEGAVPATLKVLTDDVFYFETDAFCHPLGGAWEGKVNLEGNFVMVILKNKSSWYRLSSDDAKQLRELLQKNGRLQEDGWYLYGKEEGASAPE